VSGVHLIRIWDVNASSAVLPTSSVGKVVIEGSADSSAVVKIVVRSDAAGFPDVFATPMSDRGVINFGHSAVQNDPEQGLIIRNPSDASDHSLARRTRFAAAVRGEISGDIKVGQVQRVQAGLAVGTPSGVISANITSLVQDGTFVDGTPPVGYKSIEVISSANLISGNISAGDPALTAADQYLSIGRLAVGPSTNAAGIQGSISAEFTSYAAVDPDRVPNIWTITSTGPIGSPTNLVSIRAGSGIGAINATDESNGDFVSANYYLNVETMTDLRFVLFGATQGSLSRIRTRGDVHGVINAVQIVPTFFFGGSGGQVGILADGNIDATITVEENCRADIIGGGWSPQSSVEIRGSLQGSIVAFDVEAHIPSIRVGVYGGGVHAPERTGFAGALFPPRNISAPNSPDTWMPASMPAIGQTRIDSVIRATSIGELRIGNMTYGRAGDIVGTFYPPRVEAEAIDTLFIDIFSGGAVWSGLLEYSGGVQNDPTNDYALINSVQIGCIGPGADLWYDFCDDVRISLLPQLHPSNPQNLRHGVMLGESHTTTIPEGHKIRIGENLDRRLNRLTTGGCECMPIVLEPSTEGGSVCPYRPGLTVMEDSPRNPGFADIGRVDIRDVPVAGVSGLVEQIGINENNYQGPPSTADGLWRGYVDIGTVTTPFATLQYLASQPLQAPYYQKVSSAFGNGAVGLVPYHIYREDSLPPGGDPAGMTFVSQYAITGSVSGNVNPIPVEPVFYGHLMRSTAVPPADVGEMQVYRPGSTPGWEDATWLFTHVAAPVGGNERAIRILPRKVGYPARHLPVPQGTYRIRQEAGHPATPNVLCDLTFDTPVPPVADFEYRFCVVRDCDKDGYPDIDVTDCDDVDPCPNGPPVNGCVADCDNGSGTGEPDGGLGIEDLLYYLSIYGSGNADADIDNGSGEGVRDGGVGIEDLLYFLNHYDMGC
jgi:hypothetical protein